MARRNQPGASSGSKDLVLVLGVDRDRELLAPLPADESAMSSATSRAIRIPV